MHLVRRSPRVLLLSLALVMSTAAVSVVGGLAAPAAEAADSPIAQRPATAVTADALPTVQIDGVVWKQAIVGNTVYAGGQFGYARPAGSAPGQNQTVRNNLLAYDVTTGNLVTSFAPSLNGVVKVLAVSPDKTRLYVGGAFTTADGATHNRLVAYNLTTGQVVPAFSPNLDAQVNAITVTNDAVYVGGFFSRANGVARSRLAAFSPATGALLGWAPTADAAVNALLVTPDSSKVIVAGAFANVNAAPALGLAAVDPANGALLPWAANGVVQDYGSSAAMDSLSTDGTTIYGSGYWFGGAGNFEGVWAADQATGAVKWLADCHGDTYDEVPVNGIVYSVSHHHNCDNIAGFGEQNPRQHWRANAFTADTTGTVRHNSQGGYHDFYGYGSPSLVNWFPDLTAGSFTGQTQAGWTVTANADYVVIGGEFPKVNGTAQQGLVRFAVPSKAPKRIGAQISAASSAPTLRSVSATSVRVAFGTNWDRDDANLAYQVRRNDKGATPVYVVDAQSLWWSRKTLVFTDTGLTPGTTYTYSIRESDADNNVKTSTSTSIVAGSEVVDNSAYSRQVIADGASDYWRLDEQPGVTTSTDWAGTSDLSLGSGVTNQAAGAIAGSPDTAATFSGDATGVGATSDLVAAPATFTAAAWFKTTTTSGGKILGFGNASTGSSSSYDRHVYLDNSGNVSFGIYAGATRTVRSTKAYNDGSWHQVVATLSNSGIVLYVDGLKVGSDASVTSAQPYSGYWRVGGDNLNGWPNAGSSQNFSGSIDDVAIYPTALSGAQVRNQFSLAGGTLTGPVAPSDAYGKAVYADSPDLFWRLDDASGPTAQDSSGNGDSGVYSGGVSYRTDSPVAGSTGTAATFDGATGTIGSSQPVNNPTAYSEEIWFKTTTTSGGKLIGFGDQQSGNSGSYDRHIYMESAGNLTFGTYTGQLNTITTPKAYNDGAWHHAVATQGAAGMRLYLDGALTASGTQTPGPALHRLLAGGGRQLLGGE